MNNLAVISPTMQSAPTIDGFPGDIDALHTKLLQDFEEAETTSSDARREAEVARDYKDGNQWTEAEKAVLRGRHQPVTWNNVIGRKIDLLRGLERRGRSDPKAYPRTDSEDNRADVATQVLRYIADDNRFDVVRSAVFDNMLVEGFGGAEVIVEPDSITGGYNVVINQIPWERLFYDPHSQHPGFQDARYMGVVIWMDRDEAIDRYPGCEDILSDTFDASRSNTYDDKPYLTWSDNQRRRLRVVQIYWKRKQDWWMATFTRGGFLEQPVKSPYLDRHGHGANPLVLRSARVGRDNNRFGVVRDMVPLQDSINKRESKLLHALSVNQIIMQDGAVEDVQRARQEAAKPDGVIIKMPGTEFEIHKDTAEIAGHFQLLQYAIEQMNVSGPNAAMSGKDPREQSGRAILAQQSGGQMENEPIADELRQWTHKVYEACWMRARQFWNEQKVIRITDEQKDVQFVTLNNPITVQMELQQMQPDQAQAIAQRMGLQPGDPRLQQVVRIENNLDDMDVDITVEEGPDTPTQQIEQFQQIMQLPPQILQQFPPEFIIQASALRNKDQLLKLLEQHQQAQAQAQQAQQATQQAMQAAQVAKVQADTADKQAQAQDRAAQTAQRVHGIAKDHAEAAQVPVVAGVGPVQPEMNPLFNPPPPQPANGPPV